MRHVLFERLGMPSAESIEMNPGVNEGQGERTFHLMWLGVRFMAAVGANDVVGKTAPVRWEIEFTQPSK